MCPHEPPIFRWPASPDNHPPTGGGVFAFSRSADHAQYFEAREPFTVGLASAGGFTAVILLRLQSNAGLDEYMTVFTLRGEGGLELRARIMGPSSSGAVGAPTTPPQFTYTFGGTTYEVNGLVNVVPGVAFALAFRYNHADFTMEIYVDGIEQGNSGNTVCSSCLRLDKCCAV